MKAWDKATTGNGPIAKIWGEWGSYISLALLAFVAWKLWPLFSGIDGAGSALGDGLAGLTAGISESGKRAQQRASIRTIWPNAPDDALATFEADANALAQACGAKSWLPANQMNISVDTAYALAKKYSRRVYFVLTNGKIYDQGERQLRYRLPVLYEFYKTATNGRSLMADLDKLMEFANKEQQAHYRTYCR